MKCWSAKTYQPYPYGAEEVYIELRTHLDLANEKMPELFPHVPRVGERVQSSTSYWANPCYRLTLEVVRVTYVADRKVEVELYLPQSSVPLGPDLKPGSLRHWYKEIYEKVTGRWLV